MKMKKMKLKLVFPNDMRVMYIIEGFYVGTLRGIKRQARIEQLNSGLGFLTAVLESPRGGTVFFRDYNDKKWTQVK